MITIEIILTNRLLRLYVLNWNYLFNHSLDNIHHILLEMVYAN